MDVLVMLAEHAAPSPVLAHVNSVPAGAGTGQSARDVVTLYGEPSAESLALALAAAVESRRSGADGADAIRHLGVWPERGALGDEAWRDASGTLVTRDLNIPFATLLGTAQALLSECGQAMRRLLAGLRMPEWPEGTRRALLVSLHPALALPAVGDLGVESLLAAFREADGVTAEAEGD